MNAITEQTVELSPEQVAELTALTNQLNEQGEVEVHIQTAEQVDGEPIDAA